MKILAFYILVLFGFSSGFAKSEPAKLGSSQKPSTEAVSVTLKDVQNAIVAYQMRRGRAPVRQEQNVIVYEIELSFGQSILVQTLQGNSGWQQPKGRLIYSLAQVGENVFLASSFETVATNAFGAENSASMNSGYAYNEQFLMLEFIASLAEGRTKLDDIYWSGIKLDPKLKRKTKKIGAVIGSVVPGSPAEKSGLSANDIIKSVEGMTASDQTPDSIILMIANNPGLVRLDIEGKGVIEIKRTTP